MFRTFQLDDWVLCRIYNKPNVLPPATAVPPIDQDQEEEEEPFITAQGTKLQSPASFPSSNTGNTLEPQKSSSFSNLLDAMDYAMLSGIFSDSSTQLDNLSFLEQPEPALNHGVAPSYPEHQGPVIENALKRQRSGIEVEMSHPSKRLPSSTCSFLTSGAAPFDIPGQHNNYMFNHSFSNQQLLLSNDVQFLG